ncbi:MAG: glycogen debranching enzyme family protein [Planctomycetota bacterium]|nr:MAG: glycogen debranching enzyme family protein [Planctomycetota bacterium]
MLTLQKANGVEIVSMPLDGMSLESLLAKEWLLTNQRGSYASSTIVGCNTRRYHGLLIGSLNPPANRIMTLAKCLEMVVLDGPAPSGRSQKANQRRVFNLSTFEFDGKFAPDNSGCMKRFRQDIGVHFDFQLDGLELTKSLYLLRETDTVALVYDFTKVKNPAQFILRPFVALRGFHTLQKSYAPLHSRWIERNGRKPADDNAARSGLLIRHDVPGSCELFLSCPDMNFEPDKQWWFNFVYRNDKERGQDFNEDLWTPGFFKGRVEEPHRIVFWANFSNKCRPEQLGAADIKQVREGLQNHHSIVVATARATDKRLKTLYLAADQFVTRRNTNSSALQNNSYQTGQDSQCEFRTTVLAGFPWFADWGRDAFVALPGLLLLTGRLDEAKSVLTTFAAAVDEGMIPNRFDDYSDTAYFNSIDASLWFINAAFQYLNTSGDLETFTEQLLPTIRWIIDSYYNGTRFDIRADDDELIIAGDESTQLTWMDAKYDGVAVTARCGKAVEVNALWYNSLCLLAQFYATRSIDNAKHYASIADRVKESFCRLFWNQRCGYLNDCVLPDGSADSSLRPNQIFAVSLPFTPLSPRQAKAVVDTVQQNLLTPYGLRTLAPSDSRYKGTYTGPQHQRDEAYHQGTVWAYLMGPFVEAYLRVNNFSRKSKKRAAQFIEPLLQHLTDEGCVGQISEIFDGDAPHQPRGCIAQAWSVAELIRAHQLINS